MSWFQSPTIFRLVVTIQIKIINVNFKQYWKEEITTMAQAHTKGKLVSIDAVQEVCCRNIVTLSQRVFR